jgi:hypothetical protein
MQQSVNTTALTRCYVCCCLPLRCYLFVSAALIPSTSSFNVLRTNLNNLGRLSTGGQCVASGNAIVEMYTMGLGYWPIVGILIGFYVLFLIATYLVVKRSARASLKV